MMSEALIETMNAAIVDRLEAFDIHGLPAALITALQAAGYAIVPVEPTPQMLVAGSRVPRALYDAIGDLVSECADQRDIYPDDATALRVITETVNEIYGCIESGVFGPLEAGAPDCEADCARHWTGVRNKNARLTAALTAIVERSHADPLGSSKVIDMRKIAEAALAPLESKEGE